MSAERGLRPRLHRAIHLTGFECDVNLNKPTSYLFHLKLRVFPKVVEDCRLILALALIVPPQNGSLKYPR